MIPSTPSSYPTGTTRRSAPNLSFMLSSPFFRLADNMPPANNTKATRATMMMSPAVLSGFLLIFATASCEIVKGLLLIYF